MLYGRQIDTGVSGGKGKGASTNAAHRLFDFKKMQSYLFTDNSPVLFLKNVGEI